MMNFFVLLFVALYATVSADSSGKRECPGRVPHGTQVDVGRYWYECKDSQMVPKGCLSENGRRVEIGGTFDTKDNQMKCVLGSDGFLTIVYKACVFQGGEHDVGSQWDDGTAFYTCVMEGNNVHVAMLGCVDQGRPMKFDDRVAKGDFIYQCKKSTDGTPKLNKAGCVHEGRKFNIGEAFDGPKFWYTCTDSGAKVVGCVYESHRLEDGDRVTKDSMIYTCKVSTDGASLEPFACVAHENGASIERRIGCFWVEGEFEYTCKADSNNQLSRVPTQCVYRGPQGSYFKVRPGCVQLAETVAVGCRDSGSGTLRTETYSANQIDGLSGLRKC
jgi:hypothetical protein